MNTITLITYSSHTLDALIQQCDQLGVSKDFHIEARTVKQLSYHPIPKTSLIVLASKIIKSMVEPYILKDIPIIIANRAISYSNIRQVLEIPEGTKALLVNDLKQTANETIVLLEELGVELELYPYYPGCLYPRDVEIAISVGEPELIPKEIKKVVDIGTRVIDLSTWIDIYIHFQYKSQHISKLTARYLKSFVYLARVLGNEIQRTKLLHRYLESIVDRIEDAVIAIGEDECIRIINDKALDALHLNRVKIVNYSAADCLPSTFYKIITALNDENEHLVDWEGHALFIRRSKIVIGAKFFGYLILFRQAVEIEQLEHDYRSKVLRKGLVAKHTFGDLLGSSPSFRSVIDIAGKVARSDSTVLLLGETGTGKELLAQAIHNASSRCHDPFVGVNFAAISESLLESELFGYEEGAFTGARKGGHSGLFEQAHKGTIFLDEIGDASLAIQNRLLRILQERQVMRVGGNRVIPIDVRIIAATNRDLEDMVHRGLFRADLYYRLNVLPIQIPPLRERLEDLPQLIEQLMEKVCHKLKRPSFTFSKEALKAMHRHTWPGNVRELENTIEFLAHIVEEVAYPHHLPFRKDQSVVTCGEEELMAKEFASLCAFYENKGFLTEIIAMLRVFAHANRSVGRQTVMKKLREAGVLLSEQQLRYRLNLLRQDEILNVGRGRQGSTMTTKGKAFMQYLSRHRHLV